MNTDTGIAVVHLVRAGNPARALGEFLESYQRHPAGMPHRLVVLLKGFERAVPPEIEGLLSSVAHVRIHCPDTGFDIGSYFHAAERLPEPLLMLTNSFTVLCADDWLKKLAAAIMLPGMGAAGATGSWESHSGRFLHQPPDATRPWPVRMARRVGSFVKGACLLALFPGYPNVHLRTNGFLIRRRDLIAHRPGPIRHKLQAWMFESGRRSLSCGLLRRGLMLSVVGRDGAVYAPGEWDQSNTFWQGDQSNLLIRDNQTRQYEQGSEEFRCRKRVSAWACKTRGIGARLIPQGPRCGR